MQLATVEEFKNDIEKYLDLVKKNESIWVTENGKMIARITNPNVSSVDAISGILEGKAPADIDWHSIREERLSRCTDGD